MYVCVRWEHFRSTVSANSSMLYNITTYRYHTLGPGISSSYHWRHVPLDQHLTIFPTHGLGVTSLLSISVRSIFFIPRVSEIMQHLSSWVWLISLSIMSFRFIHIVTNDRIFLCVWLNDIYRVCIQKPHFPHSFILWSTDCFYVLATVNNVPINMEMQMSIYWFHFLGIYTQKWDSWII